MTARVILPSPPLCPSPTSLESELCISRILFPFLSLPSASEPWTPCDAVTSHEDLGESNQACECWASIGSHTFDVSRWVSTEQSHACSSSGAYVSTCRLYLRALLAMDHSHPDLTRFCCHKTELKGGSSLTSPSCLAHQPITPVLHSKSITNPRQPA